MPITTPTDTQAGLAARSSAEMSAPRHSDDRCMRPVTERDGRAPYDCFRLIAVVRIWMDVQPLSNPKRPRRPRTHRPEAAAVGQRRFHANAAQGGPAAALRLEDFVRLLQRSRAMNKAEWTREIWAERSPDMLRRVLDKISYKVVLRLETSQCGPDRVALTRP